MSESTEDAVGEAKRVQDAASEAVKTATRLTVRVEPVSLLGVVSEPCEMCGRVYRTLDQGVAKNLADGSTALIACPCGQQHTLATSLLVTLRGVGSR